MKNEDLQFLDDLELELSQQEEDDLKEIENLLKNNASHDMSSKVWGTIKDAALDSVEQIIGLEDRGDWRPEQGAVVTTPLNFRKGIVATENDRKRFEMWQARLNGNTASASEFREDPKRFKNSYNSSKKTFKNSRRNPDGSYNNDYNETVVFDQGDPRTYNEADTSGDMTRDTTKTVNVDHGNSVKTLYEDDKMALYGGATEDGFDQTMRDVANNPANFAVSDEHANKSMGDKDTLEVAESNPELNMDPERVKAKKAEADAAKNKYLFKNAFPEKAGDVVKGVGKSTLAATGKMLVGRSMKIVISETYLEFTRDSAEESFLERAKLLFQKIMSRIKTELSDLWHTVSQFAARNALSEIVNIIVNYFFTTVKNIFKLIRCMIGSIIKAIKIILDSSRPWQERLFEALKVISAGIALASGTLLNEMLDKAISTYIPFLAPFSADISAVISGLISSILSAISINGF